MLSKKRISEIRKLHQKKYRDEQHFFLVEGTKSLLDLFKSSMEIEEIFATEAWFLKYRQFIPQNCPLTFVSPHDLERISYFQTPQEALAMVALPERNLTMIDSQASLLVLDNIRDPGNLGTIIRTADWFDFRQIICSEHCVEFTNPKTIQATMGSFCRINIFYTDLVHFFMNHKGNRRVIGTTLNGEKMTEVTFKSSDILLIGNESTGIHQDLFPYIDFSIRISSASNSQAESLNAAVATGIILHHVSSNSSS